MCMKCLLVMLLVCTVSVNAQEKKESSGLHNLRVVEQTDSSDDLGKIKLSVVATLDGKVQNLPAFEKLDVNFSNSQDFVKSVFKDLKDKGYKIESYDNDWTSNKDISSELKASK